MNGRQFGNLTIARALELHTSFDRFMFFPHTSEADWTPHLDWLIKARALDANTHDIVLPMQSYVVRTSHHNILIDTCVGNHKDRPTRPAWHHKNDDTYMKALAVHGLSVEDIDYVMCTHLHGDHIGWNTQLVDGRWVPTFPNAKYVFSLKELDAWRDTGDPKFSNQALEDSVLPVVAAGQAELVSNDYALDDEVWLEPSPGHTPDHYSVRLASQGQDAVMSGDLMHCPIQCLYPHWNSWPDFDPAQAQATRSGFLERYCETSTLVCTAHFPLPSVGKVIRAGSAFGFEYEDSDW